jgi:hypothetical protein
MTKRRSLYAGLLVLLLLILVGTVRARSSDGPAVNWQVLSAGGAPAASVSGHVRMNGTLGQTTIGTSSANQTTLWPGFWHSIKQAFIDIFLPFVERGN